MNIDAMKNAAATERQHKQNVTRSIPEGWGRVVCFDRDGCCIGRMNMPLDQALSKFEALVIDASTRPSDYGYSLLYAWNKPTHRLGYHTYTGTLDVDADGIAALAPAKPKRTPRTKPSPAPEAPASSEAEPF